MPEKLSADGGTILELDTVQTEPISGPSKGKRVELYYLEGHGFRFKKFGETAQDLGGGGSLDDWSVDGSGHFLPFDDATQNIGSPDFRVGDVVAKELEIFADGADFPVVTLDEDGITLGDGSEAGNVRLYQAPGGLDEFELFAETGSGTYQLSPNAAGLLTTKGDLLVFGTVPGRLGVGSNGKVLVADSGSPVGIAWATSSAASPFSQTGDIITTTTSDPALFMGAAGPLDSIETGYTNRWRFTGTKSGVVGGNLALIVDNQSDGVAAYATVAALNDLGVGLSLTAIGSGWDDSLTIGVNANDCVLAINTAKDFDPSPLPTLVFLSGLADQRWVTNPGGGNVETMRLKVNGDLLLGTTANGDPGHYLIDAVRAGNTYHFIAAENAGNGDGQATGFLAQSGGKYGVLSMTAPAYAVADGRGAAAVCLENLNGAGGVVLMTSSSAPVIVKTNGNNTRWQVDGDGKMAWNGAATVAQPTGVPVTAAGVHAALVSLGLITA